MPKKNHPFPYPSLQDTDCSFPHATYHASLGVVGGNLSINVSHQLGNATFIAAQIKSRRAMFGCIASSRHTGCKRLFLSSKSNQSIEWNQLILGELTEVYPLVVGVRRFTHTFSTIDEVTDSWTGKRIDIPNGARLASLANAIPLPAPSVPSVHNKRNSLNGKKRSPTEFDSDRLGAMRSALIDKNATDRRIKFIQKFRTREAFEGWVQRDLLAGSRIPDTSGVLQKRISEPDFTNMPREVEKQFGVIWNSLTLGAASNSSFWG